MALLQRCLRATWALAATLLVACAGFGGPYSVTLGEAELQRWADGQFPLERRLLDVFDVSVSNPRLKLLPESNRLGTGFDISVRERLLGGRWQGRLQLSSSLRYETQDQTVRLVQVRVDDFRLDNPRGGGSPAEHLGALLAERELEGRVIYRLTPERLARLQSHGLVPGSVTVTPRGIEVTFAPAP
jgi:hypothetical protein